MTHFEECNEMDLLIIKQLLEFEERDISDNLESGIKFEKFLENLKKKVTMKCRGLVIVKGQIY